MEVEKNDDDWSYRRDHISRPACSSTLQPAKPTKKCSTTNAPINNAAKNSIGSNKHNNYF
jgi:hypothetical protein